MAIREHSREQIAQVGMDGVTLQVKKLERLPKDREAVSLSGISMHIAAGEMVVIAGPGKSALLETLALRAPDNGQILINGIDLYNNYPILGGYIGYVPPEAAVHERTIASVARANDRPCRGAQPR